MIPFVESRRRPRAESPKRLVVRHIGHSLVKAMEMALKAVGPPEAAQLVAAECVVHAETPPATVVNPSLAVMAERTAAGLRGAVGRHPEISSARQTRR